MTWYKSCNTDSFNWTDFDPNNFKREYIGSFDVSNDIKKEAKPPPKRVYFDPKELVI